MRWFYLGSSSKKRTIIMALDRNSYSLIKRISSVNLQSFLLVAAGYIFQKLIMASAGRKLCFIIHL